MTRLKVSRIIVKIAENLSENLIYLEEEKKPVVFLGGDCKEDWRTPLKKEFSDRFLLLDPFDKSWKPEKNIYAEIEALLKSDHIIFYKGGKGTDREKKLLKGLGIDTYKDFDDLEDLNKYLKTIA